MLADEVDLLGDLQTAQSSEISLLEQKAKRYWDVYHRVANVLLLISFLGSVPWLLVRFGQSEYSDLLVLGRSAMGIACIMYGVSHLKMRDVPATKTGIALLVYGGFVLALAVAILIDNS